MRQSKGRGESFGHNAPLRGRHIALRDRIRDIGSIFVESVSAWVDHSAASMGAALASTWWDLLQRRLLSFGMVLGVGFLLLVSLIASALLAAFGGWLEARVAGLQIVLPVLDVLVSFAMTVLLFAMIYKYVPRETIAWRDVWVGAAVHVFAYSRRSRVASAVAVNAPAH